MALADTAQPSLSAIKQVDETQRFFRAQRLEFVPFADAIHDLAVAKRNVFMTCIILKTATLIIGEPARIVGPYRGVDPRVPQGHARCFGGFKQL